jgi:hypothetical protein
MPYGAIKVDNITFTNGGADQPTTVSGIYRAITSGVTVTGTISGVTIQGATVSGTTVTGTTANFVSGVFTTQLSGATITGTTASFTSGVFTALSGASTTVTSGIFAVGSAAAPSISFTSDPNTGIYSPGADQVAISTNGTGRLFVDASGNISNTSSFNPYATSNRGSITVNGVTSSLYALGVNNVAAGYLYADSTGVTVGAPTSKDIVFDINGEKVRIDSSGRLLVGTSTGRGVGGTIQASTQVETTTYVAYSAVNNTNDTGGSALMFGKSRGTAVGSNTIVQNNDNLGDIYFAGADGTDLESFAARITCSVDGTPGANNMPGRLVFSTTADGSATPTERMRITSAGDVGIGTNSPQAYSNFTVVSVDNATNGGVVSLRKNGTAYLNLYTNTGFGIIEGVGTGTGLQFLANNAERARIDASGRLLVGTSTARANFSNTTASAALQLEGTTNARNLAIIADDANAAGSAVLILAKQRSGGVGGNTIVQSSDSVGTIIFGGSDGSEFVDAASIEAFVDGTPGANDMPGRLVFSTTADGAASPTERMRITSDAYVRLASSTGGLQFNGDTAAVNALNDYEEGTWTPTDASGAALSFTAVTAYYTKIGRFVICQFSLDYPSTATGNAAKIGGLPFTSTVNGGGFSMYTTSSVGSIATRNQSPSDIMILTYGIDQDVGIANSALSSTQVQITFMYQFGA